MLDVFQRASGPLPALPSVLPGPLLGLQDPAPEILLTVKQIQ